MIVRHALALASLTSLVALGGCRHRPAIVATPTAPAEESCWWTVLRSPLAVDSVAAKFVRGFTAAELTGAVSTRRGDTVWVHAGPAPLTGASGKMYAARMVAYPSRDSTSFRLFVSIAPPPSIEFNTTPSTPGYLDVCGRIASGVGFRWIRPARGPAAEDSLPVWSRAP